MILSLHKDHALEIWKFHEAPENYRDEFRTCPCVNKARWLLHVPPELIEDTFEIPFLQDDGIKGFEIIRRCLIGTHHLLYLLIDRN